MRKTICLPFSFLLLLLILLGCKQLNSRPKSVGNPYEVLVVGDVDNMVDSALSVPTTGLPQAEPMVDVIKTSQLSTSNNNFRTIVVVKLIKPKAKEKFVAYLSQKDDEFVDNQLTLYLVANNKVALKKLLPDLLQTILQKEIAREQLNLLQKPNHKAETLVLKHFGKRIHLPQELTKSKVGKDFLWLSNNTAEGMMNICLYYIDERKFQTQHDSIMQQNIPGEQQGDYLTIADIASEAVNKKTGNITLRGIWRMKQEAMGGSFVTYLLPKERKQDKCLAIEAFIFAPEKGKRNPMRRLEAALYTQH